MTARDSLRSAVKTIFPALMSIGVLVFAASVSATEISANTEFNKAGHVLISDQFNNRVIEVTRDDQIVKSFTASGTVGAIAFSCRLANGDTLLTDARNSRAVEMDANDNVVWQYATNADPQNVAAPLPTRAVRLRTGDTLISDQFNNRVIRVSPGKQIVASYGLPLAGGGAIGNNIGYDLRATQSGLYSPYDAKVIGDYTRLTSPIDFADGEND